VPHASESELTTGRRLPAGDTLRLKKATLCGIYLWRVIVQQQNKTLYERARIIAQQRHDLCQKYKLKNTNQCYIKNPR